MDDQRWTSTEMLAWTEREGPGRPPEGPRRWHALTIAGVLGVIFTGVMFTDTLCPEHRAWVAVLAGLGVVGVVVSIVGLLRDWAGAPIITTISASLGVSIGLIDAAHSPTRGRIIAVAFAGVTALAALLTARYLRLSRWDRTIAAGHSTDHGATARDTPMTPATPVTESSPVVDREAVDQSAILAPRGTPATTNVE